MHETKSILFAGVGGQGIILASKIFTEGLLKFGYEVKMSEVHGMAQRGGSVITQVRFGDKVYSPLIELGKADAIAAFEKSEAARWLQYLKPGGVLVVNDYEMYPVQVLIGIEQYPEKIIEKLSERIPNTYVVNGALKAEEVGNIKAQNIVVLGALVKSLGLTAFDWGGVIRELVPERYYELNIKAFSAGMSI